jgi:RNA polymerase sigma-70 factor (ECF subfamily)
LLRAAWPAAYRLARSILDESAAAEDAAQEACARALGALETLRRPERFAAWFRRIVVNEAKQRFRTTAREVSLEDFAGNARESGVDETGLADLRLDLRAAIGRLEPNLRDAIVLRYDFGLSSAEIGRITNSSPVTARWRLMLAHRKLRASLVLASVVAVAAAVVTLCNFSAVVAGVERMLQGYAVSGSRTTPLTMRAVTLARARSDMPFAVVVPPAIPGARLISVAEMDRGAARSARSLILEIRGKAGRELTIVESASGEVPKQTQLLLALNPASPGDASSGSPALGVDAMHPSPSQRAATSLRAEINGRTFAPLSWVARGTRIVLIDPPDFLTAAEMRAIRRAMSH